VPQPHCDSTDGAPPGDPDVGPHDDDGDVTPLAQRWLPSELDGLDLK